LGCFILFRSFFVIEGQGDGVYAFVGDGGGGGTCAGELILADGKAADMDRYGNKGIATDIVIIICAASSEKHCNTS